MFFNGLNFVEKCDFSFEDKHRITYIWRSLMNICMNLKKVEPKKITTTKELAQYILESGNDGSPFLGCDATGCHAFLADSWNKAFSSD